MKEFRKDRKSGVRYRHDANVGFDRGEGIIRREDVIIGEGVEQGRLTDVGKSDDSDCECHGVTRLLQRNFDPPAR